MIAGCVDLHKIHNMFREILDLLKGSIRLVFIIFIIPSVALAIIGDDEMLWFIGILAGVLAVVFVLYIIYLNHKDKEQTDNPHI